MGMFSSKCVSKRRLDGKTAIVTGANTGIGKETVRDFFQRGARVIMACRNVEKADAAAADIKNTCCNLENLGEIATAKLDLTSLKSVRECAAALLNQEPRIDLLINNAGVMICPKGETEDGFEIQFGTNHLGHFLFTLLLLPKISASAPARIVNVSSIAHIFGEIDFDDLNWRTRKYHARTAYQQSKLANILFTQELARRLAANDIHNVNVYSLHPGVIATELGRHLSGPLSLIWKVFCRPFVKTPVQGAQTTIYCAVDEKCDNQTGLYYAECAVKKPAARANDAKVAERLWEESLILVGLGPDYNPFKRN